MNLQMMEGLVGASTNIRLSGSPMRVYRQAEAQGDSEKMKRALGYAGECTERAAKYQEKLDKGMKAEAKAEREKANLKQEDAVEKRREERKQAEESAKPGRSQESDLVQISEAAPKRKPFETAEPIDGKPVIYTPSGEITAASAEAGPTFSVTA